MRSRVVAGGAAAALLFLSAPRAAGGWSDRVAVVRPAEKVVSDWSARARSAAQAVMERYGRPSEVGEDALVWHANGPWKRTVVHRRGRTRHAFRADRDYLENVIAYDVPERALADLAAFDERLRTDAARGELSSRSDGEDVNFLALNLADEIVNGKRTVEEARAYQARVLRLSGSGRSSPYLKGLLFAANAGSPLNRWSIR